MLPQVFRVGPITNSLKTKKFPQSLDDGVGRAGRGITPGTESEPSIPLGAGTITDDDGLWNQPL